MSLQKELIDLDQCVINALKLFIEKPLPKLKLPKFKRPLVVGSGNAAVTGKIIFNDADAVFADEGNYKHKLRTIKGIDGALLISASGGKHAPIIAKELKKRKIKTVLLTNNPNALARSIVTTAYVLPKNPEPYTYNTSTYLGMILAQTHENPKSILNHINNIKSKIPRNLRKYDAFYLIIPAHLHLAREMFLTKFDELFGSKISGRIFTEEQTKHAKTVVPSRKELFISLGCKDKHFGVHKTFVPLPKSADYGAAIATGYYFIGKIQKQHPPYFKKYIEAYTQSASKLFNQKLSTIVE